LNLTRRFIRFTAQAFSLALFLAYLPVAQSLPYPPFPGVCYYFKGEKLIKQRPCSIQAGYGAGAHYVVLIWPNGHTTEITKHNSCTPRQTNYDSEGFCRYEVYDKKARRMWLSSFITLETSPPFEIHLSGDCFQLVDSKEAFCHSLKSLD
jgi:hypothetical protein